MSVNETEGQEITVEEALDKADPVAAPRLGVEDYDEHAANTPPPTPVTEQVDEVLQALLGKMTNLEESSPYLKVLVWGDPDTGKTSFAGTAPGNLFVDIDKGTTSLKNRADLLGPNSKRYPFKSFLGLETLIDYLHNDNPAFDWVDTFTLDTASELHKKGLAETVEGAWRQSPSVVNRYRAETDHHTENNERVRRLISSLKDLNRNLIITAHSRIVEPKGKPAKYFPDFSEKLASAIVALVDICVYIEKVEIDGEIQRVFHFHTDSNIMTKCRIGGLPASATDVTWDQLWSKFQEHRAKEA